MREVTEREIQVILAGLQHDFRSTVEHCLGDQASVCESPIERVFLASILIGTGLVMIEAPKSRAILRSCAVDEGFDSHFSVIPQFGWGNYRIDFAFFARTNPDAPLLFVECDGHEFHERTPDQAARDRSRDREMQAAGIPLFRFTGREIWRDPMSCVVQTLQFLLKQTRA